MILNLRENFSLEVSYISCKKMKQNSYFYWEHKGWKWKYIDDLRRSIREMVTHNNYCNDLNKTRPQKI